MPFFKNISLEVSGNDFNLTTNVNKKKLKFQISNPKSKIPEADVTNNRNCTTIFTQLLSAFDSVFTFLTTESHTVLQ